TDRQERGGSPPPRSTERAASSDDRREVPCGLGGVAVLVGSRLVGQVVASTLGERHEMVDHEGAGVGAGESVVDGPPADVTACTTASDGPTVGIPTGGATGRMVVPTHRPRSQGDGSGNRWSMCMRKPR